MAGYSTVTPMWFVDFFAISIIYGVRIEVEIFLRDVTHLSMSSPRGGGGGGRKTHGNLTVAYIPRVGILIGHHAFDLSI